MDSIEKGFADHARVLEETKALIPVVREMADVRRSIRGIRF